MLLIKICAVYYIFINIVAEIHTLDPLPIVEDNVIAATEKAIRNTVNNLFTAFKIQGLTTKPKIRQFSTIHNFFVSITLLDCNGLDEIARLSRVKTIDNNTRNFIAQINEVLNGDDKNNEEKDEYIYITAYIHKFIKELKRLKNLYLPKEDNEINAEILKYIVSDRYSRANVTEGNKTTSKTNNDSQNGNILDNSDFWQPSGRRIYKGKRTNIKHFPFLASIHIFKQFTCAGSVIKDDLIITSSSCLQVAWNNRFFRENPAFLSVRVGCDYFELCGDTISVLEIYFHPSYTPKTLKNNIAIMRLTRIISFHHSRGRVKKIEIDRSPWPLSSNIEKITTVGWGAKDVTNVVYDVHQNKISYANLDFYPLRECQEHYSREFVTSDNFCAGFYSVGGGACNRDAGGPGVLDSILVGVISFGSQVCGAANAPTVFTKLGFYTDWIDEIMEQVTERFSGKTTVQEIPLPPTFYIYQKPTTKKFIMHPLLNISIPKINLHNPELLRLPPKQSFEDFLSTMFSSEEIETYVEAAETGTKDNINTYKNEKKSNVADFNSERNRKDSKVTIEPAPIVNITDYPNDDTKENTNDKNRLITSASFEEDIIRDLNKLIDNLNLDEILNSQNISLKTDNNETLKKTSHSQKKIITSLKNTLASNKVKDSFEEITTTKTETLSNKLKSQEKTSNQVKNQVKTSTKVKIKFAETASLEEVTTSIKEKVSPSYFTVLNTEDKHEQEVTSEHTISTVTILAPVADLNEADYERNTFDSSVSDDYDDIEEEGLSIPAKTFLDLTLRDRAQNINKDSVLSEATMFDLISHAIEEQAKKLSINKQKRYLL